MLETLELPHVNCAQRNVLSADRELQINPRAVRERDVSLSTEYVDLSRHLDMSPHVATKASTDGAE